MSNRNYKIMIVQNLEADTSLNTEEKDELSIPVQMPPGGRYIEVNDLQGSFETSFHKARVMSILVIALSMVVGSYIVIQNRLYVFQIR